MKIYINGEDYVFGQQGLVTKKKTLDTINIKFGNSAHEQQLPYL